VFKTIKADCYEINGRDLVDTSKTNPIQTRNGMADTEILLTISAVFVLLNIGGIIIAYRVCVKKIPPRTQRERLDRDRDSLYGTYGEFGHYTTVTDDNDYYVSSV